jgi:hypothetical protein
MKPKQWMHDRSRAMKLPFLALAAVVAALALVAGLRHDRDEFMAAALRSLDGRPGVVWFDARGQARKVEPASLAHVCAVARVHPEAQGASIGGRWADKEGFYYYSGKDLVALADWREACGYVDLAAGGGDGDSGAQVPR